VYIPRVKNASAVRLGIFTFLVSSHEGHILSKLIVLMLVHHLLHVTLADDSAGVQGTCNTNSYQQQ